MNILGLDIGTTSICAVVLDETGGALLHSQTLPNDTAQPGADYERLQNPAAILQKCEGLLADLTARFAPISCIGISGQMHGMLYLDAEGHALSPLYTWQDESANEPNADGETYAQTLTRRSGYAMATGFGAATYFTHKERGTVPENAVTFCTIHDYTAMRLCRKTRPLMHVSNAASFGLFRNTGLCFDDKVIEECALALDFFPETTADFTLIGAYNGIPLAVAIGDNQASFLGSVRDMRHSLLVNVGTGSQISFATNQLTAHAGTELRPLVNGQFLRVGSALCGGRAFAALEDFLRRTAELVSGAPCESAYPAIDQYLAESARPRNALRVDTTFSGCRADPQRRGGVENLGLDNFTPQHLIWGVLQGIVSELALMYPAGESHSVLVGSGNGLRKNDALRRLFSAQFGKTLQLPAHTEEAAVGAALFAMTAAGRAESIEAAQALISYI